MPKLADIPLIAPLQQSAITYSCTYQCLAIQLIRHSDHRRYICLFPDSLREALSPCRHLSPDGAGNWPDNHHDCIMSCHVCHVVWLLCSYTAHAHDLKSQCSPEWGAPASHANSIRTCHRHMDVPALHLWIFLSLSLARSVSMSGHDESCQAHAILHYGLLRHAWEVATLATPKTRSASKQHGSNMLERLV